MFFHYRYSSKAHRGKCPQRSICKSYDKKDNSKQLNTPIKEFSTADNIHNVVVYCFCFHVFYFIRNNHILQLKSEQVHLHP